MKWAKVALDERWLRVWRADDTGKPRVIFTALLLRSWFEIERVPRPDPFAIGQHARWHEYQRVLTAVQAPLYRLENQ